MATHPSPGTAGIPVETRNLAKLAENAIGSRRLILTTQTHYISKHLRQFTYQTLRQRTGTYNQINAVNCWANLHLAFLFCNFGGEK